MRPAQLASPLAIALLLATNALAGSIQTWGRAIFEDCPWRSLASGNDFVLGICQDGTLRMWGDKPPFPSVPAEYSHAKEIWTADNAVAILSGEGKLGIWSKDSAIAKVPKGLKDIRSLWLESNTAIAIDGNGKPVIWGMVPDPYKFPKKLPRLQKIVALRGTVLALTQDGKLLTWGNGNAGLEIAPKGLGKVRDIATGQQCFVALQENGKAVTWGSNSVWPRPPDTLQNIAQVVGTEYSLTFLERTGKVLEFRSRKGSSAPPLSLRARSVFTSAAGPLALDSNGRFVSWGHSLDFPIALRPERIRSLAYAYRTGVALLDDGTLRAWGPNPEIVRSIEGLEGRFAGFVVADERILAWDSSGQISCAGKGSAVLTTVPPTLGKVRSVAAHEDRNYAIDATGHLVHWGETSPRREEPPQGLAARRVVSQDQATYVLLEDGSLRWWGLTNLKASWFDSLQPAVVADIAGSGRDIFVLRKDGALFGAHPNPNEYGTVPKFFRVAVGVREFVPSSGTLAVRLRDGSLQAIWSDESRLNTDDRLKGTKETDTLILGRDFGILRSR
jgi:alpha-tubulin suppressor-like RCC1 family protein